MKVLIYTRSMNFDLYQISLNTVKLPHKKKRSIFTSAEGYLYHNLLNNDADYVINIDEDVFITDNNKLRKLIEFVIDNDYINCGMPDGGVVDIRNHNPLVTNPFFNILNVKEIRKQFDVKTILQNYSNHNSDFEKFCPLHLMKTKFAYDYYEPYNPFFVWLATNFKTLFLNAEVHQDGLSTILNDHLDEPFLLHSWYSRFYGVDEMHTNRINSLYKEATGKTTPEATTISKIVNLRDKLGMKYYYPLKLRIENKLR